MVHSATVEMQFIDHSGNASNATTFSGYGIMRVNFAYNYFLLVGPVANPAGVNSSDNGTTSFTKIYNAAQAGSTIFASRGDGSGTQGKENTTWFNAKLGLAGTSSTCEPTNTTWYKSWAGHGKYPYVCE